MVEPPGDAQQFRASPTLTGNSSPGAWTFLITLTVRLKCCPGLSAHVFLAPRGRANERSAVSMKYRNRRRSRAFPPPRQVTARKSELLLRRDHALKNSNSRWAPIASPTFIGPSPVAAHRVATASFQAGCTTLSRDIAAFDQLMSRYQTNVLDSQSRSSQSLTGAGRHGVQKPTPFSR